MTKKSVINLPPADCGFGLHVGNVAKRLEWEIWVEIREEDDVIEKRVEYEHTTSNSNEMRANPVHKQI